MAQLQAYSPEDASAMLSAVHMATQRFSEGLRWLALRFPLSTRVVVRAVAVGSALVTTGAPDFARTYTLPTAFSRWAAGEGGDVGLDLLTASPVGPVTCSLRRSQLRHALETQDAGKGAVVRLRAQAERSGGDEEGGSTGGMSGGGGGVSGGGNEPEGGRRGGGRQLQTTWSLAGMSREEQQRKVVVVHIKLHRLGRLGEEPPPLQQGPTAEPSSLAAGHSRVAEPVTAQLVLVVAAVATVWLLVCLGMATATACLQAVVVLTAAIVGRHHLMPATGEKAGAQQPSQLRMHQWTVEILHAAVTQVIPDEPGAL